MIDRDSYKRLLDGVQHARKRKHRLRFFTARIESAEDRAQDMDGWNQRLALAV